MPYSSCRPASQHFNKYDYLAPRRRFLYDKKNKRFRQILIFGNPGEVFLAGQTIIYHKRRYRLRKDIIISETGVAIADLMLH